MHPASTSENARAAESTRDCTHSWPVPSASLPGESARRRARAGLRAFVSVELELTLIALAAVSVRLEPAEMSLVQSSIDDYLVASFPVPAAAGGRRQGASLALHPPVAAVQYTQHPRQDSRLAVATPGVGFSVYDVRRVSLANVLPPCLPRGAVAPMQSREPPGAKRLLIDTRAPRD